MNHNGSRREREITGLARLLPVPTGRDLPAGRRQILKEHLMTEIRRTDATSRPPASGHRRKRPRSLAAVAGAGVLAAAMTAAAAVIGASALSSPAKPAAPPGGPAMGGTPTTAAELLSKIANVAAGQPSPTVRDSEFMYIRSAVAYTEDTIVNGRETSTMEKLHERQIWLPVANMCVTGLLIEDGSRTPLSPFPVVNGKVDHSVARRAPHSNLPRPNFTCPSEGHLGDATYRLLQSLPTSPTALLNYLKGGKKWTNDDPATEIGDLIGEAIIPPAVAAALYRVAALLPGATLVPDATNATGKHGIGIAWTSTDAQHEYRTEWIFDKATLQYIGGRDYNVKTGVVNGESAILQRAFVDKAGQLPQSG
jgi:hypothetical protein